MSNEQIERLLERYSEFVAKIAASEDYEKKSEDKKEAEEEIEVEEGFEDL